MSLTNMRSSVSPKRSAFGWGPAMGFLAGWILLALGAPAFAYDPATTHAGLTQRAVVASGLHQILARSLGRPLGLFEPIVLSAEPAPTVARRFLMGRLMALDPAGGYRPSDDGVATAVAWTMAGAVIAKTPPERLQNMFLDPSTGHGLRDAAALDGFGHALRLAADSGGFRALATGTSFSFEGMSSVEWLESLQNDQGLPAFWNQMEQSVVAATAPDRNQALVQSLLALGGILTVLQDAGNPAQVRNDFRASYLEGPAGSPFDRGSRYERLVAERYGLLGVPAPTTIVKRANWKSYFTASDGQGLADRTQRGFFSDGTVPEEVAVDADTSARDVVTQARSSLTYALPTVPRLDLRVSGNIGYVTSTDGVRPILAYQRVPGRVRFFLDARVHAESARVLLPEIAGYAAGFIDHLFRAKMGMSMTGDQVSIEVTSSQGGIPVGQLRVLAEDGTGRRREISAFSVAAGDRATFTVAVPSGTRRIAAFLRGDDSAGPAVAFSELGLSSKR